MSSNNKTKEEEELEKAWLERLARDDASKLRIKRADNGRVREVHNPSAFIYDEIGRNIRKAGNTKQW